MIPRTGSETLKETELLFVQVRQRDEHGRMRGYGPILRQAVV
jgi:hypothetical protein